MKILSLRHMWLLAFFKICINCLAQSSDPPIYLEHGLPQILSFCGTGIRGTETYLPEDSISLVLTKVFSRSKLTLKKNYLWKGKKGEVLLSAYDPNKKTGYLFIPWNRLGQFTFSYSLESIYQTIFSQIFPIEHQFLPEAERVELQNQFFKNEVEKGMYRETTPVFKAFILQIINEKNYQNRLALISQLLSLIPQGYNGNSFELFSSKKNCWDTNQKWFCQITDSIAVMALSNALEKDTLLREKRFNDLFHLDHLMELTWANHRFDTAASQVIRQKIQKFDTKSWNYLSGLVEKHSQEVVSMAEIREIEQSNFSSKTSILIISPYSWIGYRDKLYAPHFRIYEDSIKAEEEGKRYLQQRDKYDQDQKSQLEQAYNRLIKKAEDDIRQWLIKHEG